MKHDEIVKRLVADAQSDPNILGFLIFGSVATGTHRENSDIDVITVLQANKPTSGIDNTPVEGIKVGNIFLTYVEETSLVTQSNEDGTGCRLEAVADQVGAFQMRFVRSLKLFIAGPT